MTLIKFSLGYFICALFLLMLEVLIGRYMHDTVIRPFGGDFLIVILIYCFVKSFFDLPVYPAAVGVLLFAYLVEVSQYFHLIKIIGMEHSKIAQILLGTTFSFTDLFVYTLGIALVIIVEKQKAVLKISEPWKNYL